MTRLEIMIGDQRNENLWMERTWDQNEQQGKRTEWLMDESKYFNWVNLKKKTYKT